MKPQTRHSSAVIVIVGVLLIFAAPLGARSSIAAKQSKLHKSRTVITFYNGKGRWALFSRYDKCWQVPSPHEHLCHVSRENLNWHGERARRLEREIYQLQHPAPQIGHEQGWLCIHSREGAWNDEGAPYYGGLQMSYGWAGRVTDAALLSPEAQMMAAEAEAAEHGWSYVWMQGQWPRTFPPCAHYF